MANEGEIDEKDLVSRALGEPRLMPGENPATLEPGDVLHWVNVYSELLGFKLRMLAEMKGTVAGITPEAASEVNQVDVTLAERQKERYEARLSFWEERARELAGVNPLKQGGK